MQFFSLLRGVDQEKLLRRPPSKWHALELLQHLYMSEAGTASYIRKKLSYSPEGLPSTVAVSWLKTRLLKVLLITPVKFKAPAGLDRFPDELSLEKINDDWALLRLKFKELIEELSEDQLKWQLFKHPIIGRINMADTVGFIGAHYFHHKRQIVQRIS